MTKRTKEKPPHIEVVTTPRGLRPNLQDDAEKLIGLPHNQVFELVPATQRSWPQLKTYWKALGIVVKATGRWPNAEKLHDELKWACGYRSTFVDWETGNVHQRPDSVALNEMSHEDFCAYMDAAMEKLAEAVGFDPLAFLSEGKAA